MEFKSNTMELVTNNNVPFLQYKVLQKIPFINHCFSTRLGGVSSGDCESMNLGFSRGDSRETVLENYRLLSSSAGFDMQSLVASVQVHETVVRPVTREQRGIGILKSKDMDSVDALITNDKEITICTYYADCTPLFFVDTKQKAIGLAHAGWRGTVGKIGKKVIEKMTRCYESDPQDIVVCIGPAISKCCYEVDKPCADEFYNLQLDDSKFVFPKGNDKYMVDLLEANRQVIMSAGVKKENITLSDLCTKCNSDLLWSHRATNGKRGVMCAMMCIK